MRAQSEWVRREFEVDDLKISEILYKWYIWAAVGYVIGRPYGDTLGGLIGLFLGGAVGLYLQKSHDK